MEVNTESTSPETEVEASAEGVVADQPNADVESHVEEQVIVPDVEEVEFEGAKYSVPKAMKEAIMRHADYTQKTQELSAQRKAIEEEKTSLQRQAQLKQQDFQAHARLAAIDEQMKAYQAIDWNAYQQQDPAGAAALYRELDQLRWGRQALQQEISQREHQRNLEQSQQLARLEEETRATLQRDIKNWSPELESNLNKFGKANGFNDQELASIKYDARQAKILNKAYLYDQMMQQAKKPAQQDPAKPVKTIQGGAQKATKDPSKMSDAEFAAWRRRQIAQR